MGLGDVPLRGQNTPVLSTIGYRYRNPLEASYIKRPGERTGRISVISSLPADAAGTVNAPDRKVRSEDAPEDLTIY